MLLLLYVAATYYNKGNVDFFFSSYCFSFYYSSSIPDPQLLVPGMFEILHGDAQTAVIEALPIRAVVF